jgi:type I restriction enzyme, S subunit
MSWPTATLRKIAPPSSAQIEFQPGEKVWNLSLDQIEGDTGVISEKRYTDASDAGSSTFSFDTDNVLYSKLRPYLNKVTIPDEPGIATTELIPLRPNKVVLDSRFLAYYLRSPGFVNQASHHVAGAKMPRVVMDWFWGHEAPLPPPKEQSRIVELLDQADALRRLRRGADAKAARILPALFVKTFGDPATNPMGWKAGSLGEFGVKARYGLGQPPKLSKDGLPLLRATNVDAGSITTKNLIFVDAIDVPASRNAFLSANEVLVVRSGAYTGDVAQVTEMWEGAVAGYDMVLTPPDGWHGEFIEQFLLTPFVQRGYFESQKGRAGQPHLNSKQLEATPAFAPPEGLQEGFAEKVRSVRRLRDQCEADGERLEQLFNVLLQKAFSGELTVKWRQAHMQELLAEMQQQAKALNLAMPQGVN